MPRKGAKRKPGEALDIRKLMSQFHKSAESQSHRKGSFKIEAPFERALDTILKVNPGPKKPNRKSR